MVYTRGYWKFVVFSLINNLTTNREIDFYRDVDY